MGSILKTFLVATIQALIFSGVAVANTFAELKTKIQDYERQSPGKTYSIAQLLSELPPELRANFTLIKKSDSLQEASLLHPRVLMFGSDASLIVTFNGDPSQKGYETLEFAEINPSTSAIEFREMVFPAGDSATGNVEFSEVNPPKCLACHGPTPHYIWTSYDQWPHAYGSNDDALGLNLDEKKHLPLFKEKKANHPRYRNLEFYKEGENPDSPFRPLTAGKSGESRGDYNIAIEYRPNFHLGSLISRRQAKARVSEWENLPSFESLKYQLAAQLAGCVGSSRSEKELSQTLLAMGRVLKDDFSFAIGAKSEANDFTPSVATFLNSIQYFLWSNLKMSGPKLEKLFIPYNFSEVAKSYGAFSESDFGLRRWHAHDEIAPVLSGFSGAQEADFYAEKTNLITKDRNFGSKICDALEEYIP